MTRFLPLLALSGLLASCSKAPESSVTAARNKALVIKVEGMQRGEGGKT